MPPRAIRGYSPGLAPAAPRGKDEDEGPIKGSTTIVQLLQRYPDGRAARLMARLAWPCARCGGAFHEPLTMAAKRHANDPRAVLDAFRALDEGGPTDEQVERAAAKVT